MNPKQIMTVVLIAEAAEISEKRMTEKRADVSAFFETTLKAANKEVNSLFE
jgi:hypothetical protein